MRARQSGVLAGFVLLVCGQFQAAIAADEIPSITRLQAEYDLTLASFSLGDFHLVATFNGSRYTMGGKAKFSVLSGLVYEGGGATRSRGRLTDAGPQPAFFDVRYHGGDKREKRVMRFADGAVSKYSIVPKKRPNPKRIPVAEKDLENVLDPLTGGFLSVRSDLPPGDLRLCRQTLRVFEGQQRFDIVLTPKRRDELPRSAPSGLSKRVAVCGVRFIPVSGHRPDHPGVKYMQKTDEVEVWLVRVPHDRMYLPYRIVVPTAIGSGSATLTDLRVTPRR